jgi:hypothetical protein
MRTAFEDIITERVRQIIVEGYTPEHDDEHTHDELIRAAMTYVTYNIEYWPWEREGFKPSEDDRENLVRACALLVSEIDRIDREREKNDN